MIMIGIDLYYLPVNGIRNTYFFARFKTDIIFLYVNFSIVNDIIISSKLKTNCTLYIPHYTNCFVVYYKLYSNHQMFICNIVIYFTIYFANIIYFYNIRNFLTTIKMSNNIRNLLQLIRRKMNSF